MIFKDIVFQNSITKYNKPFIKKVFVFPALIAAIVVLASCTNTRAIIAEKDAEIANNNALIAENNTLIDQLYRSIEFCEYELASTLEQCSEQLDQVEAEDRKLLAREKKLREQLAEDIVLKNVEIEKLRGRLTIKVVDKILFRSGSIVILPEGQEVLTRVAESLAGSGENLRVEGHTDDVSIGPVLASRIPTNWELSVLRATSVVRFLEENGMAPERLSATGHSEFKSVVDNTTDDNKQLNRRVEIVLVPQE